MLTFMPREALDALTDLMHACRSLREGDDDRDLLMLGSAASILRDAVLAEGTDREAETMERAKEMTELAVEYFLLTLGGPEKVAALASLES